MTRIRSTTRTASRILLLTGIVVAFAGGSVQAEDQKDTDQTRVYILDPSTHGNPEGVAYDKRSDTFFVGFIGDGTIYRVALDTGTVTEFVEGGPGQEAVGMKVFQGRLYVAGGTSGTVSVYDISTGNRVAFFDGFHTDTVSAGLLNDLVVTRRGDVFITDSFVPVLWHIKAEQVDDGGGTPEGIPLDAGILEWNFSGFNLNGIVALNGGRSLIVVQSDTGKLFRIDLHAKTPSGVEIHEIAVDEPLFGDGLLLDKGRLAVVTFAPEFSLTFVKLDHRAERGIVVERRTDPTLRGPSTVARAGRFYLVVNADFETNTSPFTVTALPRNDHDDDE